MPARDTYDVLFDDWYSTVFGATLQGIGNEKLVWEKTNTTNIGFDLSFFQSKYSLTFSWYNRQTVDMVTVLPFRLQPVSLPTRIIWGKLVIGDMKSV